MKILNLYSGLGGNRKLWTDCEVTAVEYDYEIADFYKTQFPEDKVCAGADSVRYLLAWYEEYNFIWASPPCPTHSQYRQNVGVKNGKYPPVMPDMELYQIIIFLKHNFKGLWVVENVEPYYKYLIEPDFFIQRHPFWSNIKIDIKNIPEFPADKIRSKNKISDFIDLFDIRKTKITDKRQALRNCVNPEIGKYILEQARKQWKT